MITVLLLNRGEIMLKMIVLILRCCLNFYLLGQNQTLTDNQKDIVNRYQFDNDSLHQLLDIKRLNEDSVYFKLIVVNNNGQRIEIKGIAKKSMLLDNSESIIDECNNQLYEVTYYRYNIDGCSIIILLSVWDDRVTIRDPSDCYKEKSLFCPIKSLGTMRRY